MKPVKKGDSIRQALTARWFNEQNKRRLVPLPPSRPTTPENPIKILCIADSSYIFDQFDPATIVGPMMTYEALPSGGASQHATLACKISTTLVANKWGIVQGPCDNGISSQLVVSGLTWATFNLQDADDTHVSIQSGELKSATSGEARIISPPPGTAPVTGIGLIVFERSTSSNSSLTIVKFTLTGNLTTTGTATVNTTSNSSVVAVSDSIDLENYSGLNAYTGAVGTAISSDGVTWFVVEVDRPVALIEAVVYDDSHDWTSGDLSRGFTADATDPVTYSSKTGIGSYPTAFVYSSLTITNPYNFNFLTGDTVIAKLKTYDEYEVVAVQRQQCTQVRFKLYSDAPTGLSPNLTVIALAPQGNDSGEPPSGSFTVKDIYGICHNAKSDHKGIAQWDFNNGWWYAIACEHIATRFIGTLQATLSGSAATISVTPVTALNGKLPSGTQTVKNTYSWSDGTTGHKIAVEWNPVDGQWETYQMRCPS